MSRAKLIDIRGLTLAIAIPERGEGLLWTITNSRGFTVHILSIAVISKATTCFFETILGPLMLTLAWTQKGKTK